MIYIQCQIMIQHLWYLNLMIIILIYYINNTLHLHSWSLYNIVLIQNNGWVLLSEMNKYINVLPQKFKSIVV